MTNHLSARPPRTIAHRAAASERLARDLSNWVVVVNAHGVTPDTIDSWTDTQWFEFADHAGLRPLRSASTRSAIIAACRHVAEHADADDADPFEGL